MERRIRFELLYAKHAPAVKAYVLRRAHAAVADDVVADVFLVCWRRFDELPVEPLPWLLGIARRALSTQRRGERRGAALQERLAKASASTAAAAPPDPAGDGALARALERLAEDDRELLLLIAWEGLTPAQAAEALGARAVTVRVRLHRARRRLARALEREQGREHTRRQEHERERGQNHDREEPVACAPLPMEASP